MLAAQIHYFRAFTLRQRNLNQSLLAVNCDKVFHVFIEQVGSFEPPSHLVRLPQQCKNPALRSDILIA